MPVIQESSKFNVHATKDIRRKLLKNRPEYGHEKKTSTSKLFRTLWSSNPFKENSKIY